MFAEESTPKQILEQQLENHRQELEWTRNKMDETQKEVFELHRCFLMHETQIKEYEEAVKKFE